MCITGLDKYSLEEHSNNRMLFIEYRVNEGNDDQGIQINKLITFSLKRKANKIIINWQQEELFYMAKTIKKDYFGLAWIISLILAIIPITSWVLGFITRFSEGHWVCGLIRLIFGWNIIWILDIIFMIFTHHIFKLFQE